MQGMSSAAKKELYELIDDLPEALLEEARRRLEELREQPEDPLDALPPEELARLDAAIAASEREFEQGLGIPAEDLLRELRSR